MTKRETWTVGERLTVWDRSGKIAACVATNVDAPTKKEASRVKLIAAAPELLEMTKLLARTCEYQIRRSEKEGDDEGVRLQTFTLHLVNDLIARAA